MRSWQEKALRKGRKPLPERPGDRPWLNQATANNTPAERENESKETSGPNSLTTSTPAATPRAYATRAATARAATAHVDDVPAGADGITDTTDEATAPEASSTTPGTTESSAPSYSFWHRDDLRRLIELRNGGAKWATIAEAFPERTLEALKQTYHKRRHAMEAQMAEERAASSEAN